MTIKDPGPGHNNPPVDKSVADKKLQSFVERIERLTTEKDDLAADIREVFAEAKGNGFDTKVIREMVRLRKMEEPDRKEWEELRSLYGHSLGVFG